MTAHRLSVTPAELQIILAILALHVPDRETWTFGSRARGTAKRFSDLDLAILGDQPLSLAKRADLADAFSESALPYKVDVVDWASTAASFRKIIESSHVKLCIDAVEPGSALEAGPSSQPPCAGSVTK